MANNLFEAISEGWNQGEGAQNEAYRRRKIPVELVEPSSGRIVEFHVTETDERFVKMYMSQLTVYAECLEQNGVKWKTTENTILMDCTDNKVAENIRKQWRK